jgi:hypothetical protein
MLSNINNLSCFRPISKFIIPTIELKFIFNQYCHARLDFSESPHLITLYDIVKSLDT